MPDPMITTKGELTGAIDASWGALTGFLDSLSPHQLTAVIDHAGWSVKDHLAHIARWQASVAVLFHGRPRHAGLGISEALHRSGDFDRINAVLHDQMKDLALAAVMTELRRNHEDLILSLGKVTDADLNRRVSEYFPQVPADDDRRMLDVVFDNTAHHYAEHLGWIEALVQSAG